MKKLLLLLISLTLAIAGISANGQGEGGKKVLNRYVIAKIKLFDPAQMSDKYTSWVYGDIGEALFDYKYTTDTFQLKPLIASSMPTVSDDGMVYTIKLRKDAYFYDPLKEVFPEGKGRAVNAHDFVFSIKRLADPANESTGWWLYDGYIKGLNEWADAGADYDQEVEGFKALDDYTIQMTLNKPYPQILYTLSMPYTYPVPKEMIDFYGEEWKNYAIGTGAYYLNPDETIPDAQYVMDKNPSWHGGIFPEFSEAGPETIKILGEDTLKSYASKKLPFADEVVWYVIEESSVQWLKFMNGELDYTAIPKDNYDATIQDGKLTQEMIDKGITLNIWGSLDVTYNFFNMNDPILGQNKKLRQAMSLAYNHEKALDLFYNGRAKLAQTLLPPGVGGYDPNYKNPYATYDLEKAKQLLAEAGYPNGEGLPTLEYQMYSASTTHRQMVEFFIDCMKAIGVNVEAVPGDWPTFNQRIDRGEVQLGGIAWGADYPDAQNFLQLNYGPNSAPGPNSANYNNPTFNSLYEKGAFMQQSPERDEIYKEAAQLAAEDVSWIMGVHRLQYFLDQPWTKTYMYKDIGAGYSKYIDFDQAERASK
ncbi:ABC transporter substrate-binding protein [Spirochaeta cellobiosiphila]|uniref:ABC transporter substrate-binding protein n=1 Tax=Spirochaeta cellobiosiphila TaxID=504483 RepID=UPI0003F9797E|nr:ABC transporter substrate-binding protein [Spirochaeta cellobiosiphila]